MIYNQTWSLATKEGVTEIVSQNRKDDLGFYQKRRKIY